MSEGKPQEPWQWSEAHWRRLVNQVRAGRSYRPTMWKGRARCAVALSFDSDHETNELRDGGGSIGRLCWGQYGNRVGLPRILEGRERSRPPREGRARPAAPRPGHPREDHRHAAGGPPDAVVGFQPPHPPDREGDGA